jgi:aminodeoxychorismate lyase
MNISVYCIQNGKLIKESSAKVGINNRSFRYGDGCFETMKMIQGNIVLYAMHAERLLQSLQQLQFDVPMYFNAEYLLQQIQQVAAKNNHTKLARVRLTVYRGDGGLYDVANHFPNYTIQTWALNTTNNQLNENGLDIAICPSVLKTTDAFANIKSNNYLGYAMAALWAKQQQVNDALVCNAFNHIADATIANIVVVKNNQLFTPPLQDGCVQGIVRKYLLAQPNLQLQEKTLTKADIIAADELFLTNSMYGIRWVKCFENYTHYSNSVTQKIYKAYMMPLLANNK